MIRENRQEAIVNFEGGLDFESPPLKIKPGALIDCRNFECDTLGGYTLSKGYERFDGQPSPSEGATATEISDRRALIAKPPGSGQIRGAHVYGGLVYAFRDAVDGLSCKMYVETNSGWDEITTGVTLNPAGRYQIINYNFEAGANAEVMIGVDGANKAFMYDGTDFTQITVPGETTDFPLFCAVTTNYLWLGFEKGYLYYSVVGAPADFDSASGAGGLGTGDYITGLDPVVGGSLVVRMRNSIAIISGESPGTWVNGDLRNHDDKTGAQAYSAATYGQVYYLDEHGITNLQATEAFGSFNSASISRGVNPYINSRFSRFSHAYQVTEKNQLRWVFLGADAAERSEVLTLTFSGNQVAGWSAQVYNHRFVCTATAEDSSGNEIIVSGTEDGWVMKMETGTSFDGANIRYRLQTAFNHFRTPMKRKHFLKALFQIDTTGTASILAKPIFNYGSAQVAAHRVGTMDVDASGGVWNESQWNEFKWSSQIIEEGRADISGTGKNLGWVISGNSDTTSPFTISECLIYYTMRGWER